MFHRTLSAVFLVVLFALASAIPDETYEPRWCTSSDCPPGCYDQLQSGDQLPPADSSSACPIIFGLNTNGNAFLGTPSTNVFTDQYRHNSVLTSDDVDVTVLNYNHIAAGNRSTTKKLLSHMLVLGTKQTKNVNVVWAIFGANSLPSSIDGNKVVSESVIRNRVAETGTEIPSSLRLLGSARLKTKDRVPDYIVGEQQLPFYSPEGFTQGCVGMSPPFTYEICNYTNGILINPNEEELPSIGQLVYVIYEENGKPVPYILSSGSNSILNYVPIPAFPPFFPGYTPAAPFISNDTANIQRALQKLLDIGAIIKKGTDLGKRFDVVPVNKKRSLKRVMDIEEFYFSTKRV